MKTGDQSGQLLCLSAGHLVDRAFDLLAVEIGNRPVIRVQPLGKPLDEYAVENELGGDMSEKPGRKPSSGPRTPRIMRVRIADVSTKARVS